MIRRPPGSTRTATLLHYPTLFRSRRAIQDTRRRGRASLRYGRGRRARRHARRCAHHRLQPRRYPRGPRPARGQASDGSGRTAARPREHGWHTARMTRFALTIEYDGRPYMGWQRQAHGPSVQQTIEEAIRRFTAENVQVFSAGRTDAGVHAIAMRAHVDIAKPLTPFKLTEALNAQLRPAPIAITGCEIVPDDWHARFACIGRDRKSTRLNSSH